MQFWIGTVVLPVLLAVSGLVATFAIAPWQEQRAQSGVERREAAEEARQPPVEVGSIQEVFDPESGYWVLAEPLPPAEEAEWTALFPGEEADLARRAQAVQVMQPAAVDCADWCPATAKVYRLSLYGSRSAPVEVLDIHARVLSRNPAPDGAVIKPATGALGEVAPASIDLDSDDRRLYSQDEDGVTGDRPYFQDTSLTLAKGEHQTFGITTTSRGTDYRYELVVTLEADGERTTVAVRPNGTSSGAPFRNPGTPPQYSKIYECDMSPSCHIKYPPEFDLP
ncbi:hypothetical protein [Streptomyces sp. CMB-StM0423]|uniref:hypothetical protein n=1 Tax=Streptomyces sp. CMB-StM0423 TaxID=2059884 RepID=UPI00131DEE4D|nr:hypothetical protein [Streptomyces sp. CMB-StM0423]